MRSGLWRRVALVGLATLALAACGGEKGAPGASGAGATAMGRIEGSVIYRERIMLPAGVRVTLQLEDISRPDAMASVLATVEMTPEGGPPYLFAIEYDPAHIDSRKRYALRATISHEDNLLFTNMDYIDPFSGNPVEVLVHAVPQPVKSSGLEFEDVRRVAASPRGEPVAASTGDRHFQYGIGR